MRKAATLAITLSLLVSPVAWGQTPFVTNNLDGWEGLKANYWSYKDGAIVGAAPDGLKFNTFLCSKNKYRDFELKFQVRLSGGANSGVQIRSEIMDAKTFAVKGPQCDMGQIYWGSLYGEHFGGMMKQAPKDVVEKMLRPNDFNDYYIKAVGKSVLIKLNGAVTVDADFPSLPEEGIIAWQLHSGGPMEVVFRNIQFTDLSRGGTAVGGLKKMPGADTTTTTAERIPVMELDPSERRLFPRLGTRMRRLFGRN